MISAKSTLRLLLLLAGLSGIGRSFAENPNLIYYFEDNKNPAQPTSSGEVPYTLYYRGETHQSTEQAKFGHGSMKVAENSRHQRGLGSLPQEFSGDIHKMSIVAWIRPARIGEFSLVRKRIPMERIPNSFALGYVTSGYDCMMFGFLNSGANQGGRSSKIRVVISEEWIHMAVTFDKGKVAFYLNGLPYGDMDASSKEGTTIQTLPGLNVFQSFYDLAPGSYVDDFGMFFDRAFTAQEIETIYETGLEDFLKTSAK
ncbi:MAG: LamG-like jellyroll fold domain-containing protein [Chthoniobacterales bacterium]